MKKERPPRITEKVKRELNEDELANQYMLLREFHANHYIETKENLRAEKNYRGFVFLARFLAMIKRTNFIDQQKLPDENGILFISNHIGSYDQIYLTAFLKQYSVYYLVKQKVAEWFFRYNFIYKPCGVIVIEQADVKSWLLAKNKMIQMLLHKKNILIFPEGTRKGENNIGDFSKGVTQLAQETGCKIVTLAIKNVEKASLKNPVVAFGDIIELEEKESIENATKRIENSVLEAYDKICMQGF